MLSEVFESRILRTVVEAPYWTACAVVGTVLLVNCFEAEADVKSSKGAFAVSVHHQTHGPGIITPTVSTHFQRTIHAVAETKTDKEADAPSERKSNFGVAGHAPLGIKADRLAVLRQTYD